MECNTFQMVKNIRNAFLNKCVQSAVYREDKLPSKIIEEIKSMKGFNLIDPTQLKKEECLELGFSWWNEDKKLLLIPFWMLPFLIESFKGSFIGDEVFIENINVTADEDHRFGMLPYGLVFEYKSGRNPTFFCVWHCKSID